MQKGIQILKKAALLLSSKRQWSNRVLQFFCKGACGDLLKLWGEGGIFLGNAN
jgi:hypothetical protein